MNKWVFSALAIGTTVVTGLIIHQVVQDLSDCAKLWKSVTDEAN